MVFTPSVHSISNHNNRMVAKLNIYDKEVSVKEIKPNPKNPRIIRDDKFLKLVESIKDFPEMLELREIVVDENMIILGGNMRFKACISAGVKKLTVKVIEGLTDEKKDEFIIKDNANYGDWDWDVLANDFSQNNLAHWGLDVWTQDDYTKYETDDPVEIGSDPSDDLPDSAVEGHKPTIIQLEFEIGDYQYASELVAKLKAKQKHIGAVLVAAMKQAIDNGNTNN